MYRNRNLRRKDPVSDTTAYTIMVKKSSNTFSDIRFDGIHFSRIL